MAERPSNPPPDVHAGTPPGRTCEEAYRVLADLARGIDPKFRDDVIQNAAVKLMTGRREWTELENLEGYCVRALHSALARLLERARHTDAVADVEEIDIAVRDTTGESLRREELERVISHLRPEDARVVRLRILRQMSVPEIVESLLRDGRVVGRRAVESQVRRAMVQLRALVIRHGFSLSVAAALLAVVA